MTDNPYYTPLHIKGATFFSLFLDGLPKSTAEFDLSVLVANLPLKDRMSTKGRSKAPLGAYAMSKLDPVGNDPDNKRHIQIESPKGRLLSLIIGRDGSAILGEYNRTNGRVALCPFALNAAHKDTLALRPQKSRTPEISAELIAELDRWIDLSHKAPLLNLSPGICAPKGRSLLSWGENNLMRQEDTLALRGFCRKVATNFAAKFGLYGSNETIRVFIQSRIPTRNGELTPPKLRITVGFNEINYSDPRYLNFGAEILSALTAEDAPANYANLVRHKLRLNQVGQVETEAEMLATNELNTADLTPHDFMELIATSR